MPDENENLISQARLLKLLQRARVMRERNAKERGEWGAELEAAQKAFPSFHKGAFHIAKRFDMADVGKRERLWRNVKYYVEECMGIGGQGDLEDAMAAAEDVDTRSSLEQAMDGDAPNPVDALLDGEAEDGDNNDLAKVARFKLALAECSGVDAVRLGYNRFLEDNRPVRWGLVAAAATEARMRLVALGEDPEVIQEIKPPKRRRSGAQAAA